MSFVVDASAAVALHFLDEQQLDVTTVLVPGVFGDGPLCGSRGWLIREPAR